MEKSKDRNVMRCLKCGFGVYTNSEGRGCAKCETPMNFICKESEELKNAK